MFSTMLFFTYAGHTGVGGIHQRTTVEENRLLSVFQLLFIKFCHLSTINQFLTGSYLLCMTLNMLNVEV